MPPKRHAELRQIEDMFHEYTVELIDCQERNKIEPKSSNTGYWATLTFLIGLGVGLSGR